MSFGCGYGAKIAPMRNDFLQPHRCVFQAFARTVLGRSARPNENAQSGNAFLP
jgi:hypothetical protein